MTKKWIYRTAPVAHPSTRQLPALIEQMARDNETWGYQRIHGELSSSAIASAHRNGAVYVRLDARSLTSGSGTSSTPTACPPATTGTSCDTELDLQLSPSGLINHYRPGVSREVDREGPVRPLRRRTTTVIHNVRQRDRLGGLLHEYQQVA